MNVLKLGRVLPGMAMLCLLYSCGSKESSYGELADVAAPADSTYSYSPSSSKVSEGKLMVRKAEMNFKVNELQKTSQKISSITAACGGEVWNSHLRTDIHNSISKKISADSILEVITYRQTNDIMIRVPSRNLDSLLVRLENLSILLHDKKVTTDNVSLDYLSNELKSQNMSNAQENHTEAMETKKSNLEKYTEATYNNVEMSNEVVDRKIANLALMDEVKFSTVKISIYQDEQAYKNIVPNLNSDKFEPAFGSSAIMAVQDGWSFMLSMLVFLLRIWPLYLFVTFVFFLIRYVERIKVKISKN